MTSSDKINFNNHFIKKYKKINKIDKNRDTKEANKKMIFALSIPSFSTINRHKPCRRSTTPPPLRTAINARRLAINSQQLTESRNSFTISVLTSWKVSWSIGTKPTHRYYSLKNRQLHGRSKRLATPAHLCLIQTSQGPLRVKLLTQSKSLRNKE